jgi:hypothetical protein
LNYWNTMPVGGGGRGRDQEGVVGDGQQSYWSKIFDYNGY